MNAQEIINSLQDKKHPHFQPGDTVRVHIRITEGEKERIQIFQGIVIAKKGGGNTASFIVRKMSFGVGVERIFPMQCSNVEKVEVVEQGRVRQSKLFYIRKLKGKSLRIAKDDRKRNITNDEGLTETTAIEQPKEEVVEASVEASTDKKTTEPAPAVSAEPVKATA